MLGIGGAEFFVILIVAVAVVPAKDWPDVARAAGRFVRWMRRAVWKIQDAVAELEEGVARDLPVDSLTQKTMDDMIATFSSPIKTGGGRKSKKCKK